MQQMSVFDFPEFWGKKDISINKPIRLIELFAGYGSQAMALKRIGANFEHYRVCEFDKYAVQSYNAVHGTDFSTSDIRDLKGSDLGIVDKDKYFYFLTYSFPCTDLSVAGKMAGMSRNSNTRSGLLWEVERLLTETEELPQLLFMENVKQVIGTKNMPDFQEWLNFLESKGYTNYYQVLNAKDYGVPQNRERCFMFSFLGDYTYRFPDPIPLTRCVKDILEDEVDEKYYIRGEKAECLIADLKERNIIADRQTDRQTVVDGTLNNPQKKYVGNCIPARYDSGIHNRKSEGILVVEDD